MPPCIYVMPAGTADADSHNWDGKRVRRFPPILLSLFGISRAEADAFTGYVGFRPGSGSSIPTRITARFGPGSCDDAQELIQMPNPSLDRDRVEFLAARQRIGEEHVAAWPRHAKSLPLVEVDVSWVRFSTLNHRTRAEQRREIARAQRMDLFTSDPLGTEAQQAQYRILQHQNGFSDLRTDLHERGQQEPAILTADGVLINGNRRTAALRSLLLDDHDLTARYVRCLLLPEDATSDELVDLETELQVARDFREEYSWINESFLIEELYEREDRDWGRVAKRVHRTIGDVRAMYEKLQQVHQLVELSAGCRLHVDFDAN